MKQGKFQYRYHWLLGLEEYFSAKENHSERYETFVKALYHDNWFRKRDILLDLVMSNGEKYKTDEAKGWINILLREHLDINDVKPEFVVSFLYNYMEEESLLKKLQQFVYAHKDMDESWSEDSIIEMPDIGDFLSRGQMKSKLWLVNKLKKFVDGSLGKVVFYGGWHNFIAHLLFENFEVDSITSIDLNPECMNTLKYMYDDEIKNKKFKPMIGDVNKIKWVEDDRYKFEGEDKTYYADLIINTSCEHMDNTWYDKLPSGTVVALQTNDYFDNDQHINCCVDIEDAKSKYPMSYTLYSGILATELYNRFMLIGIK